MSKYFDELCRAMLMLAERPNAIFLGQAVAYEGTSMRRTLLDIAPEKLLEFPVAEDFQMGMSIGMSLGGYLPISIFPRWNFLLLATNQLVLHLDKLPIYSDYRPKVIIRTAVATPIPLDPGPQHLGNFSEAFDLMLKRVDIVRLHAADGIVPAYRAAMESNHSTILVEYMESYQ